MHKPRSLLFFDQYATFGGAQVLLADLAQFFESKGYGTKVLLAEPGPLATLMRERGIGVWTPSPALKPNAVFSIRFALSLLAMMFRGFTLRRQLVSPIFYCNGLRVFPAVAVLSLLLWRPCILHVHIVYRNPFLRAVLAIASHFWLCKKIVAVSEFTRSRFPKAGRLSKVRVISNWIPSSRFQQSRAVFEHKLERLKDKARTREWVIGMIGRPTYQKGADLFVHAASRVAQSHSRVRFVIQGNIGHEKHQQRFFAHLKENAKELFEANKLTMKPASPDIVEALSEIDILVAPSRDVESFGLVAVEGMACGCLMVVSDVPNLCNLVKDGETGFIHERNDAGALYEKLEAAIASNSSSTLSSAREYVMNAFDPTKQQNAAKREILG